jgi:hypothetical protein
VIDDSATSEPNTANEIKIHRNINGGSDLKFIFCWHGIFGTPFETLRHGANQPITWRKS